VIDLVSSAVAIVSMAAVRACGASLSLLSYVDSELLLSRMNFNLTFLTECEHVLLAIIAIRRPELVPEDRRSESVAFLLSLARSSRTAASLAMVLLIIGRDHWIRADSTVAVHIMHLWLTHDAFDDAKPLLLDFAARAPAVFLDAVRDVAHLIGVDTARRLCELVDAVAFAGGGRGLGARASLAIAEIAVECPGLAGVANETIEKHAKCLRSVAREGTMTVVGLESGIVHVFRRNRRVGEVRLVDGPIEIVSVAPGERRAGAVSLGKQKLFSFAVPSPGILRRKGMNPQAAVVQQADANGQIVWRDEVCYYELNV
jgi:hypothetical protein